MKRTPTIPYPHLFLLKATVFSGIQHVSPETSLECMCVSVYTTVTTLLVPSCTQLSLLFSLQYMLAASCPKGLQSPENKDMLAQEAQHAHQES